jgi:hypothetical protein
MNEDQKNATKEFQKFCEGMPFADMMKKMMEAKKDGGSFNCAEMMNKVMGSQKEGCSFNCAEVMQKMMKERSTVQKEPEEAKDK